MDDADFNAVREASDRWMAAWVAQDRAKLEAILADDYALVVSTVPTIAFPRSNWLDIAVGAYVCTRFEYDGVQLRRVADDMIAMSAIADFDATMAGIDRSGRYFVTDLWRREGGSWKVCGRYSSRPGEVDDSVRAMADAASR